MKFTKARYNIKEAYELMGLSRGAFVSAVQRWKGEMEAKKITKTRYKYTTAFLIELDKKRRGLL